MRTYELTYIVSPEITSEEAESKGKEIESLVQSREGVIVKQSTPTAKPLSYPIKKRASGFLGVLEFQMEPEKIAEIKEILVKDGKIVRHMVIIKEAAEFKKARRSRIRPELAEKAEVKEEGMFKEQPSVKAREDKGKVELKNIEEKLEEILGE